MSKARILVVEDEPSLRMGMVDGLLSEGFEVEEAADGEAGLQAAMDTPFDAMVLDLMLPKLDGFEVLRRLITGFGNDMQQADCDADNYEHHHTNSFETALVTPEPIHDFYVYCFGSVPSFLK